MNLKPHRVMFLLSLKWVFQIQHKFLEIMKPFWQGEGSLARFLNVIYLWWYENLICYVSESSMFCIFLHHDFHPLWMRGTDLWYNIRRKNKVHMLLSHISHYYRYQESNQAFITHTHTNGCMFPNHVAEIQRSLSHTARPNPHNAIHTCSTM